MFISLSFYQTPVTSLQMPVVASSCHDCLMRHYPYGGRALSTDSETNSVWGSSMDRYAMVNVSFNWMPTIEILLVKTKYTAWLPMTGCEANVHLRIINSAISDINSCWGRTNTKWTGGHSRLLLVCLCRSFAHATHVTSNLAVSNSWWGFR